MSRIKDKYYKGQISDLTISEKTVLDVLAKNSLDNWDLINITKLSESTITKALRKLKYRGLIIKEHNKNKIPLKVLKKIEED